MNGKLGSLLDDARRRDFVGRRHELDVFERALAGDAAARVLFVHGPGGVGKTTLLDRFRLCAADHGRPVVHVDGREQNVTRETFLDAVGVTDDGRAAVFLVDGYELLALLDPWLRQELLPSLPADAVVVLAGRDPPRPEWRVDPGWRRLVAVLPLENFGEDDATALLDRVGVPGPSHRRLVELSRGHPLALALLAEAAARDGIPDTLAHAPAVVDALLPALLDRVPSDAHQRGLEICAHAWMTSQSLVIQGCGPDAHDVWHWLASRPFVANGPTGLYPHDLARDVLRVEVERRSPESRRRVHDLIHRFARSAVTGRVAPGEDAHAAAMQLLYLHKDSPLTRAFWELRDREALSVSPARARDHELAAAIVEKSAGGSEAALVLRWLELQPDAMRVVRGPDGLLAFAIEPTLPADPALDHDDPVARAILQEVARRGALRPGERISVGRFFGGSDGSQTDPYAMVCGSAGSLITWSTLPLAWSWIVTVEADLWAPVFDYLGFEHTVEVPGDRTRVGFGMDWRRVPYQAWLDVMAERELSGASGPVPRHLVRPAPLDRARFDGAVRAALRELHDPAALASNPLAGSNVISARRAGGGPLATHLATHLADAVRSAVAEVGRTPQSEELARVLDRTYLRPAPSQEAAAEVLDMSFSTYRRRLARAVEAMTDVLWAVEIGERRLDPRSDDGLGID